MNTESKPVSRRTLDILWQVRSGLLTPAEALEYEKSIPEEDRGFFVRLLTALLDNDNEELEKIRVETERLVEATRMEGGIDYGRK